MDSLASERRPIMHNPTILTDATVVVGGRLWSDHVVVIDGAIVRAVVPVSAKPAGVEVSLPQRFVLPGFIDVHVHGAAGVDVLHGAGSVQDVANCLPQWGVTAFCPTSLACAPHELDAMLADVRLARAERPLSSAKVLPAHLESNFINPAFRGAQPLDALRLPDDVSHRDFSGRDVITVIDRYLGEIGIVTLAPELPGGLDLVRRLTASGVLASIGHTGATFEEARAAIDAGVSRVTHLFSAMPPLAHRNPGVLGAVLTDPRVFVELICDGVHVHPAAMLTAIAAKTPHRVVAITDGTAASGLPTGSRARLGGRPIIAADAARLDDGSLAGSVLTMNRAFATLVRLCNLDLATASRLCATNPADDMRLGQMGRIEPGAPADFVVLDADLAVDQTWIDGVRVWPVP